MSDEMKLLQDKIDVLQKEMSQKDGIIDSFKAILKEKNETIDAINQDKNTLILSNVQLQNKVEELIKQVSDANLVIHNADKAMVHVKELLEIHADSLPSDKKTLLEKDYKSYKHKIDEYTYSERQPMDEETLKKALETETKEKANVNAK